MANKVTNIGKGRFVYYATLPAAADAFIAVVLAAAGLEADDALQDYDDLAAMLAAGTSISLSYSPPQGIGRAAGDFRRYLTAASGQTLQHEAAEQAKFGVAEHVGPARRELLFLHQDTGWQAKVVVTLLRGWAFWHGAGLLQHAGYVRDCR